MPRAARPAPSSRPGRGRARRPGAARRCRPLDLQVSHRSEVHLDTEGAHPRPVPLRGLAHVVLVPSAHGLGRRQRIDLRAQPLHLAALLVAHHERCEAVRRRAAGLAESLLEVPVGVRADQRDAADAGPRLLSGPPHVIDVHAGDGQPGGERGVRPGGRVMDVVRSQSRTRHRLRGHASRNVCLQPDPPVPEGGTPVGQRPRPAAADPAVAGPAAPGRPRPCPAAGPTARSPPRERTRTGSAKEAQAAGYAARRP